MCSALWSTFSLSDKFLLKLTACLLLDGADELDLWNLAEGMAVPNIVLERASHIIFETLLLHSLPEVPQRISRPLGQRLLPLHIQPEGGRLGLGLILFLKRYGKDFHGLSYRIPDMLLSKSQSLAIVVLVVEAMVPVLGQQLAFLHGVCDPPGLVHIALKVVLWSQRIAYWLQLESEALVKLRKNSSIFFDDGAKLALFVIIASLVAVRNVEN